MSAPGADPAIEQPNCSGTCNLPHREGLACKHDVFLWCVGRTAFVCGGVAQRVATQFRCCGDNGATTVHSSHALAPCGTPPAAEWIPPRSDRIAAGQMPGLEPGADITTEPVKGDPLYAPASEGPESPDQEEAYESAVGTPPVCLRCQKTMHWSGSASGEGWQCANFAHCGSDMRLGRNRWSCSGCQISLCANCSDVQEKDEEGLWGFGRRLRRWGGDALEHLLRKTSVWFGEDVGQHTHRFRFAACEHVYTFNVSSPSPAGVDADSEIVAGHMRGGPQVFPAPIDIPMAGSHEAPKFAPRFEVQEVKLPFAAAHVPPSFFADSSIPLMPHFLPSDPRGPVPTLLAAEHAPPDFSEHLMRLGIASKDGRRRHAGLAPAAPTMAPPVGRAVPQPQMTQHLATSPQSALQPPAMPLWEPTTWLAAHVSLPWEPDEGESAKAEAQASRASDDAMSNPRTASTSGGDRGSRRRSAACAPASKKQDGTVLVLDEKEAAWKDMERQFMEQASKWPTKPVCGEPTAVPPAAAPQTVPTLLPSPACLDPAASEGSQRRDQTEVGDDSTSQHAVGSPPTQSRPIADVTPAEPAAAMRVVEFTIHIAKTAQEQRFGVVIDTESGKEARIRSIGDGLVSQWNMQNPTCEVRPLDRIVEVNDARGDSTALVERMRDNSQLRIVIARDLPDEGLAASVDPEHAGLRSDPDGHVQQPASLAQFARPELIASELQSLPETCQSECGKSDGDGAHLRPPPTARSRASSAAATPAPSTLASPALSEAQSRDACVRAVVLGGFRTVALNTLYLERTAEPYKLGDRESYWSQKGDYFIFRNEALNVWGIEKSRRLQYVKAGKSGGIAHGPTGFDIASSTSKEGWWEWDKEYNTWVQRPGAGVARRGRARAQSGETPWPTPRPSLGGQSGISSLTTMSAAVSMPPPTSTAFGATSPGSAGSIVGVERPRAASAGDGSARPGPSDLEVQSWASRKASAPSSFEAERPRLVSTDSSLAGHFAAPRLRLGSDDSTMAGHDRTERYRLASAESSEASHFETEGFSLAGVRSTLASNPAGDRLRSGSIDSSVAGHVGTGRDRVASADSAVAGHARMESYRPAHAESSMAGHLETDRYRLVRVESSMVAQSHRVTCTESPIASHLQTERYRLTRADSSMTGRVETCSARLGNTENAMSSVTEMGR